MAKANKLIPVVDGTAGTPIELTDSRIEITNPAANDLLQYDSTQQQFVNTPASSVVPTHRTVNHEQITDSSFGDINLHDGFYFPNAVQDYDGNWYGAVVIGDQVWLGENLRTTHYADGTAITKASTTSATAAVYLDNSSSPIPLEKRGYHYNYFAFSRDDGTSEISSMTQGIAPNGWHIPTHNETQILKSYLNRQNRHKYNNTDNYIAKSIASTDYWGTSETVGAVGYDKGSNNSSGFNALPCGTTSGNSFSSNATVFWSGRNAAVGTKPMIISASSTTITTTTTYGAIWACSVRCVSNLTPLQFRDWYVKTYGTMQHNIHPIGELSDVEIDNTPVDFKYIPDAVTDYDGNSYWAVVIGNKVWMAENLRTTHYADGTAIALGTGNTSTPSYFNNTSSSIPLEKRGYHYNYPAVTKGTHGSSTNPSNLQGVAPNGWHVPSDAEFLETENYISAHLGGSQISSEDDVFDNDNRFTDVAFAKSIASKDYWQSSDVSDTPGNNPNLNNSCGLGLTPNGIAVNGDYSYVGQRCYLWTCTSASGRYIRRLTYYNHVGIYRYNTSDAVAGYNVRCVYNGTPQQFMDEMYSKLMDKQILVYDKTQNAFVNKNVAEALPSMSGNSGKVLAVNSTETDVEWVSTQECMWYGVRKDRSNDSTTLERIGNLEMHKTLPIQSKMRRCLLLDNGTVNYYLSDTDSTKKEDGVTAAVLDGTDGQVMVEIPEHYVMYDTYTDEVTGHEINEWKISECPLPGFTKVNKCYYSAYEAALDRTNNKLSSVVNTTAQFRGGNNTSSWDGTYRSLLGMPVTNITTNTFRALAKNRGYRWSLQYNALYTTVCTLYLVEYANTNIQLDYNSSLTPDGYHQGGLGNGVTTVPAGNNSWPNYNNYNPMCPCGITNSLGNNSGTVSYTIESATQGEPFANVNVPSYRGIENLYGHIWKFMDGVIVQVQSNDAGGESKVYKCDDISKFTDVPTSDYEYIGNTLRTSSAWVKNIMFPCMIPQENGATSTTGWADAFSGGAVSAIQNRVLRVGGMSILSSSAGIACIDIDYWFNYGHALVGTRLCYTPMTVELPPLEGNSGKVLAVNSGETGVEWVTQSGGSGGASQLNDLSDVTISSAASGQALLHNGTNWVNGALPQEVLVCNYDTSNNTMDKTPAEIVAAKAANKIVICKLSYPTTDFLFLNQANSDPFVVFTGFSQTTSSTSILTAKYHVLRYTTTDSWKFFTFNIQQQLVSGTNIKTVNGNSLLGSGDLTIGGVTIYSGSTAPSSSTGSNGDIYIQTVS